MRKTAPSGTISGCVNGAIERPRPLSRHRGPGLNWTCLGNTEPQNTPLHLNGNSPKTLNIIDENIILQFNLQPD